MKGDRELCTAAVAQNYHALEYVPKKLKGELEFVKAIVYEWRQNHYKIWNHEGMLTDYGITSAQARIALQQ